MGGGGNDTFAFNSGSSGSQTIFEPPGDRRRRARFLAGARRDLDQSQPVRAPGRDAGHADDGPLTLTLADPLGIDSVLGSSYDDTIIGNANDNTLIGGGGDDLIAGLGGNDLIEGAVTRTVFLDFNTYELPGQHFYTQAERDAIQAQLDGRLFRLLVRLHPDAAAVGAVHHDLLSTTRRWSASRGESRPRSTGAISTSRARRHSPPTGLEVIPADSGGVNVNNFLGGPGEPAATSADFIGLSATIAAHELGHLSGPRARRLVTDRSARGSTPGSTPTSTIRPIPDPTDADETILHIMASGASVNATLYDAINDPFFGEREAINSPTAKMARRPTNRSLRITRWPTPSRSRSRRWSCPTPTSRA